VAVCILRLGRVALGINEGNFGVSRALVWLDGGVSRVFVWVWDGYVGYLDTLSVY